jgi:hypothetical protein
MKTEGLTNELDPRGDVLIAGEDVDEDAGCQEAQRGDTNRDIRDVLHDWLVRTAHLTMTDGLNILSAAELSSRNGPVSYCPVCSAAIRASGSAILPSV